MINGNELLQLTDLHITKASTVFAEAFEEYPLFKYLIKDPTARPRIYSHIFQLMVKHTIKNGEAYTTSENMEGIVLWLPSEKSDISLWSNLTNGGISILLYAGFGVTYRSMVFTDFANKLHYDSIDKPHIYLFQIGVQKKYRGKGFSGKLMKPMMAIADSKGQQIYLETHDELNIPIYKHYQFEIVRHEKIPGSNLNHWAMIRDPQ